MYNYQYSQTVNMYNYESWVNSNNLYYQLHIWPDSNRTQSIRAQNAVAYHRYI